MVDPLTAYVQDLVRRGYDVNTIRTYLLRSGYQEQQVEQAIQNAYGQGSVGSSQNQNVGQQGAAGWGQGQSGAGGASVTGGGNEVKHIIEFSKPTLMIFGGVFVCLILLGVFGYFLFAPGTPGELLDLRVVPSQTEVEPGEELSFTVNIENLGGKKRYDVPVKYEVLTASTRKLVTLSSETVAVETKQSMTTEVIIPSDTKEGEYILLATATYKGNKATAEFSFRIEKEEAGGGSSETESGAGGEEDGAVEVGGNEGVGQTGGETTGVMTAEFPAGYSGTDYDEDGIPDDQDQDHDNDDILNIEDSNPFDTDNDGIINIADIDDDGDDILDEEDDFPLDSTNTGRQPRHVPRRTSNSQNNNVVGTSDSVCPADCNDFDICTIDSCVAGVCEYTQVTPCCGNFICEEGETVDLCPEDCVDLMSSLGPSSGETIDEAKNLVGTNPQQAKSMCSAISSQKDTDLCFDTISREGENEELCDEIRDVEKKDACYMHHAIDRGAFSVCPKISNRLLKNSCYSLANLQNLQDQLPETEEVLPDSPE